MTIQDEMNRLKAKLSTDAGWQEFENIWMVALNHEKRDGQWFKKAYSMGNEVAGFAIDAPTKEYRIGTKGKDHHEPHLDLLRWLAENGHAKSISEAEGRVVRGQMVWVPGWVTPILLLNGFWDKRYAELEAFILEDGFALPIRALFEKRFKTKSN